MQEVRSPAPPELLLLLEHTFSVNEHPQMDRTLHTHTPTQTVESNSLAHVRICDDTSGCGSCASLEGRYVLNHSSH